MRKNMHLAVHLGVILYAPAHTTLKFVKEWGGKGGFSRTYDFGWAGGGET